MKRVIVWVASVASLIGLGMLIHFGTPTRPRWHVPMGVGDVQPVYTRLTRDRVLVVRQLDGAGGPLEVRDAANGKFVQRAWENGGPPDFILSEGGRWAIGFDGAAVRWLDTSTLEERRAPLPAAFWPTGVFGFTPDESMLYAATNEGPITVIDLKAGAVIATLRCDRSYIRQAGGRLFYPDRSALVVWDLAARRERGRLPLRVAFAVNADGTRVLAEDEDGFTLFDVADPARPAKLAAVAAPSDSRTAAFQGGMAIVYPQRAPGPEPIHFLDAATGRTIRVFPVPGEVVRDPTVSADGRFATLTVGSKRSGTTSILDIREGRVAWTLPPEQLAEFSPDSRRVLVFGPMTAAAALHDTATGALETTIRLPQHLQEANFRAGGKQLWLAAIEGERPADDWLARLVAWIWPMREDQAGVLLGLEWPSRRVLLRVPDAGVKHFHVAEDGSYVITVHEDGLRRYDVPQPKPWAWSIGVPLALGAALLGLWRWWPSRREEKS